MNDEFHFRVEAPELNHLSGFEVWAEYFAADTRGWFNSLWNGLAGNNWHWSNHDRCLGCILGPLAEC